MPVDEKTEHQILKDWYLLADMAQGVMKRGGGLNKPAILMLRNEVEALRPEVRTRLDDAYYALLNGLNYHWRKRGDRNLTLHLGRGGMARHHDVAGEAAAHALGLLLKDPTAREVISKVGLNLPLDPVDKTVMAKFKAKVMKLVKRDVGNNLGQAHWPELLGIIDGVTPAALEGELDYYNSEYKGYRQIR